MDPDYSTRSQSTTAALQRLRKPRRGVFMKGYSWRRLAMFLVALRNGNKGTSASSPRSGQVNRVSGRRRYRLSARGSSGNGFARPRKPRQQRYGLNHS